MNIHKHTQTSLLASMYTQHGEEESDEWHEQYGQYDSCAQPTQLRAGIMQPAPASTAVVNPTTIQKGRERA